MILSPLGILSVRLFFFPVNRDEKYSKVNLVTKAGSRMEGDPFCVNGFMRDTCLDKILTKFTYTD